jgi:hypothetical protein
MVHRHRGDCCALALFVMGFGLAAEPGLSRAEDRSSPWRLRETIVVDEQAWGWNWASWDQEKIVTVGNHQYTVYWDADKVLVLVRRDLRNDRVQTLRLPTFTLASNDGHRNTCLGVSAADGRLHLSWDHHNNPLRYTRSRVAFLTDPPATMCAADIEPARPMLADPKLEARVTYPRFLTDRQGTLLFIYRIGGSGRGNHYLHRYDPKRGVWSRLGMLFSLRGTYAAWENSTSRCAYLHDVRFDTRHRLHATWVYREVGRSWASNHDLHYAYSDDGGLTWRNNAGTTIADLPKGDPIELSDAGIVVRPIPVYSWLMNQACMALDSRNRPHVVTYMSPVIHKPDTLKHSPPAAIRKRQCFVHYWRDDDGTWRGGKPIDPGDWITKRPDVIFDRNDTLYFHYPTPKGFRGMHARASETWQTWSSYLLTGDMTSNDATKHDRVRWREKGILSVTAKPTSKKPGFAILEFVLGGSE